MLSLNIDKHRFTFIFPRTTGCRTLFKHFERHLRTAYGARTSIIDGRKIDPKGCATKLSKLSEKSRKEKLRHQILVSHLDLAPGFHRMAKGAKYYVVSDDFFPKLGNGVRSAALPPISNRTFAL